MLEVEDFEDVACRIENMEDMNRSGSLVQKGWCAVEGGRARRPAMGENTAFRCALLYCHGVTHQHMQTALDP